MKETRKKRISTLYMREVSLMLLNEVKDPRIGFVTVTSCEVSDDLAFAKVKFSILGADKDLNLTMHGLRTVAKHIQGEIARRLRLRTTPTLAFEFDPGVQKSIRIMQLLRKDVEGAEPDTQLPYVSAAVPDFSEDDYDISEELLKGDDAADDPDT
ncbi:MAG: 30S ribosome-binding factor RbfA [Planctomycetota bacterium]